MNSASVGVEPDDIRVISRTLEPTQLTGYEHIEVIWPVWGSNPRHSRY